MPDSERIIIVRKITRVCVVFIAVVMLAACGGGGGGGVPTPTPPDTEPGDVPGVVIPPPVVEPETRDFPCGISAATGICRIPTSAVVVDLKEMSKFLVITEGYNFGKTTHSDPVQMHACDSYIEQCQWDSDDVPFTVFHGNDSSDISSAGVRAHFVDMINGHGNTRIVSASLNPFASVADASTALDDGIVFVVSAGNDSGPSFNRGIASYDVDHDNGDGTTGRFLNADGGEVSVSDEFKERFLNLRALALANRLIIVAGWQRVSDSYPYTRAPGSNGCGLLSDSCLYANYNTAGHGSGTSFSAPNVALGLASAVAVAPNTQTEAFVRMLKACAKQEPQLDGLGRVDFTCMTIADSTGGWRLITQDEFSALLYPGMMNSFDVPGTMLVSASFRRDGLVGGGVSLGTTRFGQFNSSYNYSAGIPSEEVVAQTGFSPILVDLDNGNLSIGGRYSESKFLLRLCLH